MPHYNFSDDFKNHPRLAAAIAAYRAGDPVLLLDDADRENEADIVAAAENLKTETMVRMIRNGSGIVCLCLDQTSADDLVIEAAEGVTTGVSAVDRVRTIAATLASIDGPRQIVSPGHVFPLRARDGGVLERRGHTEGSLDLAVLAGLRPASVLCELMNDDGTMAGNDDIQRYAEVHNLPVLTIEEIAAYRSGQTARCA